MHQLGVLATPKHSWWGAPDGCTSNTKTQLVGRNYELKHRNPKAKRDDEQSVGVEQDEVVKRAGKNAARRTLIGAPF